MWLLENDEQTLLIFHTFCHLATQWIKRTNECRKEVEIYKAKIKLDRSLYTIDNTMNSLLKWRRLENNIQKGIFKVSSDIESINSSAESNGDSALILKSYKQTNLKTYRTDKDFFNANYLFIRHSWT